MILVNIILAVILMVILLQGQKVGSGLGVTRQFHICGQLELLTKFTSIIAALFIICSIAIVAFQEMY